MRKSTASSRWSRFAVAALVACAAPRSAGAFCPAGPVFGQLLPNCGGDYCYVVSPGRHTPQSLAGSFWSFGAGHTAIGAGADNGAWPVDNWLITYGSNLYFGGSWDSSQAIDGCITGNVAPGKPAEIMVALFSDQGDAGEGFFAVASARRISNAFPEFDFTFAAGGGLAQDIGLATIPRARVASYTRQGVAEFTAPNLGEVTPGIYGDGSLTAAELIKGYRVYTHTTPLLSNRTSAGWSAVTGILLLGQNAFVTVPPGVDRLYGYALVFEGDFETAHVGHPLQFHFLCHPTDADGDGFPDYLGDPECCPDGFACDCNDANAGVHPGALEVCNGIDDDCNATIDDVGLPGSVALNQFEKLPGTTGLSWPALAVATSYDVVRGDLTTLLISGGSYVEATQSCVADGITLNSTDDPLDPDPNFGFWYLVRAANCSGVGSFDAPDLRQAAPRDAGIAASGHSCP
jgi:hypothetical protein